MREKIRITRKGYYMVGSLLGVAAALIAYYFGIGAQASAQLGILFSIVSSLLVLFPFLMMMIGLSSIQTSEKNTTSWLGFIFRKDMTIKVIQALTLIFSFAALFIALDLSAGGSLHPNWLIPAWLLLTGIAIDGIHLLQKQFVNYLDPLYIMSKIVKKGKLEIRNEKEIELYDSIDSLTEICLKACEKNNISLSFASIDEIQRLGSLFLGSSKSIATHFQDEETKQYGITDKVSYTLFFATQRFEMINDYALKMRLEPICSCLISSMGKLILSAAKCDFSLVAYPLHCFGRITIKAQKAGLKEVGPKAICTLIPLAKSMLTEIDVTYLELQEPFFVLISQLQEISREIFRQDKNTDVRILTQPFKDLKELFSTEQMSKHQDTPAIIKQIERAQGEFDALEAVLRTMPPIPPTQV